VATERLTIENFKGIKHLDLEVKPFTVLIGPQSVGKSVVAKLLYYFKSLPWNVLRAARISSDASLDSVLLKEFRKLLPPPNRNSGNSLIRYEIGDVEVSFASTGVDDSQWEIGLPQFVRDEFAKVNEGWRATQPQPSLHEHRRRRERFTEAQGRYFKILRERVGPSVLFSPLFIPAGRSFYSQIEKDMASYFETERSSLDPFLSEFGRLLSEVKTYQLNLPISKRSSAATSAAGLTEELLSGKYGRDDELGDYIKVKDGRSLPSLLWSSGQQESFPLAIILEKYCQGSFGVGEGAQIFVEEPEAHLFPTAQKTMVELLTLAFNSGNGKLNFFITTHSPYVLSTLNNLLKAGQLYQQHRSTEKRKAISDLVPEMEALAPGSVGAYSMTREECSSIIDEETHLIDGRGIDDVSEQVAEQFDALLDLQ
jgi:hypothetical protein